jgi:hypothetical protein
MPDSSKRSELTAQLAALQEQQHQASVHATFLGWTPDTMAEYERCADLISLLAAKLEKSSAD